MAMNDNKPRCIIAQQREPDFMGRFVDELRGELLTADYDAARSGTGGE